jgi:tRNA nucleotidyltransferase (CCA-adding enzyme)
LRVLHEASFRDDPTRLLRLARYAARLAFTVEPETLRLARRDAVFIDQLSPARLAHELERGFAEPLPERMLAALSNLHALRRIFPALQQTEAAAQWFARLRDDGGGPPGLADYLCALGAGWPRVELQRLGERLELRHDVLAALRDLPGAVRALRELTAGGADPVQVVEALARYELAAVRGAGANCGGSSAKLVRRYIGEWRLLRPRLRGDDLLALGVPPGPRVGEALRALTVARLRGKLPNDAAERSFVRKWLEATGTSG